ncbi:hypothetical protein H4219_001554 [Mycoemilia scoparia]|uniref:PCI domain-containing protein n=1 Tax=Mycoemilia scoparia TaxID=417184 RepID=A0A9W7ZZS9_9FUNG|nr:hypothetical protein H4219_001554 [Mycoemilia scoparia]
MAQSSNPNSPGYMGTSKSIGGGFQMSDSPAVPGLPGSKYNEPNLYTQSKTRNRTPSPAHSSGSMDMEIDGDDVNPEPLQIQSKKKNARTFAEIAGSTNYEPAYTKVKLETKSATSSKWSPIVSESSRPKIKNDKVDTAKYHGRFNALKSSIKNQNAPWPNSLKQFVFRSYAACSRKNTVALDTQLKQIISSAFTNKKIQIIDWDARPLPKACTKTGPLEKDELVSEPSRPTDLSVFNIDDTPEERRRREMRLERFRNSTQKPKPSPLQGNLDSDRDIAQPVKGTCTKLEKGYLRLTSAPDPSTVRPLHILKKAYEFLQTKWIQDSNYTYICDQLKSLRQDLVIQHITNDFTVKVYETHARIALEVGDVGEYNQCQTQLKRLYAQNIPGCQNEFLAYLILYYVYTKNSSDINTTLNTLTDEAKKNPAVSHALKVRTSVATQNYHCFFKLYTETPNMGGFILDLFLERERCNALKMICKAYRPHISIDFLCDELAFDSPDECLEFLRNKGALFTTLEETYIKTQESFPAFHRASLKLDKVDIKGQKY